MEQQQNKIKIFVANRKAWLDYLFYVLGRQYSDYSVTSTFLVDGEPKFTKWKDYMEAQESEFYCSKVNQRTPLLNEVVLEFDGEWSDYLELIERLKREEICFFAYATSEHRAKHIHLFFNGKLALMPKAQREAFRTRLIKKYGCDPALNIDRHMVALEFCPHWKTGKVKELISSHGVTLE